MEIQRILKKFDSLMEEKNFDEAERLLEYWIAECEHAGDIRNRFTLLNELVGFYRMRGERPQGIKTCRSLLDTVEDMDLSNKVSGATAFINVATAYKGFDLADKALPLYEKALAIYERDLEQTDSRLPALYNNMALTLMEFAKINKNSDHDVLLTYIEKTEAYFEKAMNLLRNMEGSENEQAITYLNVADLVVLKSGIEEADIVVEDLVKKSYELLEKSHADGSTDFKMTAEKCIPAIRHYGYFAYANDLQDYM